MSKPKDLYIGTFQTRKKIYVERCMAHSEKQAWLLFCRRISKKAGIPNNVVMDWFQNTENYSIRKEIEFKEME